MSAGQKIDENFDNKNDSIHCLKICQMLTVFQNSFTAGKSVKLATKIRHYPPLHNGVISIKLPTGIHYMNENS